MEDESTYVPPEILDDMDEDTIHARMLAVIPDSIDKTEGGFVYDFTMPAAIEKADMVIRLNEIVKLFFPEWSYDSWLDMLAQSVNLTRRSATPAEAILTVEGAPDTVIPVGYLFSTASTLISENIEFAVTEAVTIDSTQTVQVPVVCTTPGTIGNVSAESITLMASPLSGIESVTNEAAATGGTDGEDDDTLRARIMAVDRYGDLSFVGNDSDYIRWAQEINGVGSVVVVPEWQGAGTGTVKLIVMDSNGSPATQTILDNVYEHIMSPDDAQARLANTGVILTVVTATALNVTITATVKVDDTADIDDVAEEFASRMRSYFEEAKAEGEVRYTRVGRELSETTGVEDYTNLTINSGTANIIIASDKYPVIQTITLSEET